MSDSEIDYNEMMDQYEKDRNDLTHTWICKDAVMNELDNLLGIVREDKKATIIIRMIVLILNRLPEHRFSLMDEVKNEKL